MSIRIYEPPTVLLVEDSPDDERLALRAFRQCERPLLVKVARDGMQATELLGIGESGAHAGSSLPALVLCDVKLPKLHGHEVLRLARANPATATTPFVMFSSSDEVEDVRRCFAEGANSYVRKPVGYEEYLRTVCEVVGYWLSDQRVRSRPFCEFAPLSATPSGSPGR